MLPSTVAVGKHAPDIGNQSAPPDSPNGTAADALPDVVANPPSGRDSRGRSTRGNPGRPPRHRNAAPSPSAANGEKTVAATETVSAGASGRDARGRFAAGYRGGPGNPFARRLAALRHDLCTATSDDDIRTIARQLLHQAQGGDLPAINALFRSALGRPAKVADPDTLAVHEWQTSQKTLVSPEDVSGLRRQTPPEAVLGLLRIVVPGLGETFRQQFLQQLGASAQGEKTV
jgi:hypothetical protein